MSKPSSKFAQFFARLKDKTSSLFKRKKKDVYEDEYEYEYEEYDEEYEEEYEDDQTDPSFQTLTVTDIKRTQGEPPSVPLADLDDDEEEYSVDEDHLDKTNPSFKEFGPTTVKKKLNIDFSAVKRAFSRLNTDGFFEALYSPQNRPTVHRVFLIALVSLSSYLTGRILTGFLSPAPASKTRPVASNNFQIDPTRNYIADLRKNDLFQAPEAQKNFTPKNDKPINEVKICKEASKKSSLSLQLVNTIVLQDEVKSLASVQIRGKDNFLRIGDKVPNMIEVGKIDSERLIFKNLKSRECEYIETKSDKRRNRIKPLNIVREPKKARSLIQDDKDSGITNVGNVFKIKKAVRENMLANISDVLTQARAVQIKNPDGTLAFKMQEIVPGSIYSKLNIQENDIIDSINGKKITSMNELMSLFGQIDKIDHFELGLKRDGSEQNLEYNFE